MGRVSVALCATMTARPCTQAATTPLTMRSGRIPRREGKSSAHRARRWKKTKRRSEPYVECSQLVARRCHDQSVLCSSAFCKAAQRTQRDRATGWCGAAGWHQGSAVRVNGAWRNIPLLSRSLPSPVLHVDPQSFAHHPNWTLVQAESPGVSCTHKRAVTQAPASIC